MVLRNQIVLALSVDTMTKRKQKIVTFNHWDHRIFVLLTSIKFTDAQFLFINFLALISAI